MPRASSTGQPFHLGLLLAVAWAVALPGGAAVPLHDRLSCPDCGGGVNPHVPLLGGDSDFDPDPTLAALRRLGVDLKKSRPLPGSAAKQTAPSAAAPATPADTTPATSGPASVPQVASAAPSPAPAPLPTPAPLPEKPAAKSPATVSGYTVVSFGELAGFALPDIGTKQPVADGSAPPDLAKLVPEAVRQLDGKKVLVTGFMLPTKLEDGFATEFFLFSSPLACCFGTTPAPHEWISVKMRKEGLPAVQHVPMPLAGRLRLRPQWDHGRLLGLYELEGDGLLKPKL